MIRIVIVSMFLAVAIPALAKDKKPAAVMKCDGLDGKVEGPGYNGFQSTVRCRCVGTKKACKELLKTKVEYDGPKKAQAADAERAEMERWAEAEATAFAKR